MITQSQFIQAVLQQMAEKEVDGGAFDNAFLLQLGDEVIQQVLSGTFIAPNGAKAEMHKMEVLNRSVYFDGWTPSQLSADILAGATTIPVESVADFPASGTVYIDRDIATYTGKNSTSLTGVTGLNAPHAKGVQITVVVPMPADYFNAADVFVAERQNRLDFAGNQTDQYFTNFWTLAYDLNQNPYLKVETQKTGKFYTLTYNKKPDLISEGSVSDLNDIDFMAMIPVIVAGRAMQRRMEANEGERYEMIGFRSVQQFYASQKRKYSPTNKSIQRNVQRNLNL